MDDKELLLQMESAAADDDITRLWSIIQRGTSQHWNEVRGKTDCAKRKEIVYCLELTSSNSHDSM